MPGTCIFASASAQKERTLLIAIAVRARPTYDTIDDDSVEAWVLYKLREVLEGRCEVAARGPIHSLGSFRLYGCHFGAKSLQLVHSSESIWLQQDFLVQRFADLTAHDNLSVKVLGCKVRQTRIWACFEFLHDLSCNG